MVQNWRLLAALLSLPILSLSAGEATIHSHLQEIALGETAYNTNTEKKGVSRKNKAETAVPEEEAIRSQPVITPQVAPQVVDGYNFFVTADFIYWRTNVDGMEYAYSGVADDGYAVPHGASVLQGSAHAPDFSFKPGVKVGLGWQMDHDGWDLVTTWTLLTSGNQTDSASTTAGSRVGMKPVQQIIMHDGGVSLDGLTSATSAWKQDFNVIDIELGRDFFLSRHLTMRPHFGFKSAWIHETTKNTYVAVPVTTAGYSTASLYNTEHMYGFGIRGGLDTGWHITKNWMFYGDLAFTNLWGKFKKSSFESNNEPIYANVVTQNTVQTYYTVIPVIEAGFGLSHVEWFCKNRYRFEARVGWEEQVWLDYNRSQGLIGAGNLSVHGLTVKAMFNF